MRGMRGDVRPCPIPVLKKTLTTDESLLVVLRVMKAIFGVQVEQCDNHDEVMDVMGEGMFGHWANCKGKGGDGDFW